MERKRLYGIAPVEPAATTTGASVLTVARDRDPLRARRAYRSGVRSPHFPQLTNPYRPLHTRCDGDSRKGCGSALSQLPRTTGGCLVFNRWGAGPTSGRGPKLLAATAALTAGAAGAAVMAPAAQARSLHGGSYWFNSYHALNAGAYGTQLFPATNSWGSGNGARICGNIYNRTTHAIVNQTGHNNCAKSWTSYALFASRTWGHCASNSANNSQVQAWPNPTGGTTIASEVWCA